MAQEPRYRIDQSEASGGGLHHSATHATLNNNNSLSSSHMRSALSVHLSNIVLRTQKNLNTGVSGTSGVSPLKEAGIGHSSSGYFAKKARPTNLLQSCFIADAERAASVGLSHVPSI